MTRSIRRNLYRLDSGRSSDHSRFDHLLHHLPLHCLHANIQWASGRFLGRGSFGCVYLRFYMPTREWVAAKECDLKIRRPGAHQDAPMDQLNEEIRLLASLDHANIVKYRGHEVNLLNSRLIIYMEYVPGGSLSELLQNRGPLLLSAIKHFTRQILMGLIYIHSRCITHRDIKSANILVDDRGVCKISDFGVSRINHGSASMHSMRGTVYNMAPEVVNNNGYSCKADIWSLACTVIEMWTADHPWPNQETASVIFSVKKKNYKIEIARVRREREITRAYRIPPFFAMVNGLPTAMTPPLFYDFLVLFDTLIVGLGPLLVFFFVYERHSLVWAFYHPFQTIVRLFCLIS
ncbi:kinase-like domain-containing protein [Gongronella butleri]|nr:kinase-like domain-containing protein [Gongronella butleri]